MKYTIKQFNKDFPDDDSCLEYMFRARFGDSPVCPKCRKQGFFYRVKKLGFGHSVITHSKDKYVSGKVYTNTIEGFWSQIKRSINGTYHSVSAKHLQAYIDEFSYRYNHRFSDASLFQTLLSRLCEQHDLKVNKNVSLWSKVFS